MFGAQEIGFSGFTRNSLRPPEAGFAAHTATNCCSSYVASKRRGHPTNQELIHQEVVMTWKEIYIPDKNVFWNLLILRYGKKLMSCQAQELKKVIKFLSILSSNNKMAEWIRSVGYLSQYMYISSLHCNLFRNLTLYFMWKGSAIQRLGRAWEWDWISKSRKYIGKLQINFMYYTSNKSIQFSFIIRVEIKTSIRTLFRRFVIITI